MKNGANLANGHGSYAAYISGFVLSILLTLLAFYFVEQEIFQGWTLAIAISILAIGQLFVQVLFFLHLGREERPRWNLISFLFMILVVLIVVIGSLWIMYNLDYNMMHDNVDYEIMEKENIYR